MRERKKNAKKTGKKKKLDFFVFFWFWKLQRETKKVDFNTDAGLITKGANRRKKRTKGSRTSAGAR